MPDGSGLTVMTRVAVMALLPSGTDTVYLVAAETCVGVPLITPVEGSITSPAGRLGTIEKLVSDCVFVGLTGAIGIVTVKGGGEM